MLERQVEEQRALARGHEQRSVAEAGRLQTMEKLLEKKDLERTSMMVRALPPRVLYIGSGGALMPVYVQRQLNSRPTPELASYIEGFKVAQAGVDSTAIEGIEGGERMGEPPPPALRPADLPSSLATVVSRVACSAFAMLGFGSIGTSESAESIPSSIGFTHMGPPREPELSLRDRPPSPKKSARQTLYMVERRSVKGAADAHGGPGPAPGTPRPSVLDLLDDSVFATLHTLFPSCCFRPSLLSCLILHLHLYLRDGNCGL